MPAPTSRAVRRNGTAEGDGGQGVRGEGKVCRMGKRERRRRREVSWSMCGTGWVSVWMHV